MRIRRSQRGFIIDPFRFGSPPSDITTSGGIPIDVPFILYTPITVQTLDLTPINAPFTLYTPITIQPLNLTPIDMPFTLRN